MYVHISRIETENGHVYAWHDEENSKALVERAWVPDGTALLEDAAAVPVDRGVRRISLEDLFEYYSDPDRLRKQIKAWEDENIEVSDAPRKAPAACACGAMPRYRIAETGKVEAVWDIDEWLDGHMDRLLADKESVLRHSKAGNGPDRVHISVYFTGVDSRSWEERAAGGDPAVWRVQVHGPGDSINREEYTSFERAEAEWSRKTRLARIHLGEPRPKSLRRRVFQRLGEVMIDGLGLIEAAVIRVTGLLAGG